MRRGRLATAIAAIAGASLVAASSASNASVADTTSGGSSYVSAITVNSNANKLSVAVTSTNGLDTSGLSTLASDLTQLPLSLTSTLTSAVTALTGTSATNPSTAQPRPAAGSFPASCSSQGWNSSDCYNLTQQPINVPGVANIALGTLQGYATGDSAGYVAGSSVATTDITLLGGLLDVGNLGVTTSLAQCGTGASPTCSAAQSLTGASLLGGAVTAQVAQSSGTPVLSAAVGGTPLVVGATAVPVGSTGITAGLNNNLLTLTVPITLNQLLGLFGNGLPNLVSVVLSSLLSTLSALLGTTTVNTASTSVNLVVTLGPGQLVSASTGATAYGLRLTAGLNANIAFSVKLLGLLGLGSLNVTASGTLLDLGLGYSAATAGAAPATWIPASAI